MFDAILIEKSETGQSARLAPVDSSQLPEGDVLVDVAWSENDAAVYTPGSLILNRSEQEHRITTAKLEPRLLTYGWIGPSERLATPGMKFSATKKAG